MDASMFSCYSGVSFKDPRNKVKKAKKGKGKGKGSGATLSAMVFALVGITVLFLTGLTPSASASVKSSDIASQKIEVTGEKNEKGVVLKAPGAMTLSQDGMTREMRVHVSGPEWKPGRPELVIIGSPSCPYCLHMETMMQHLCNDLACDVTISKIDVTKHGDSLKAFGIDEGVPVLIFFSPEGRRVHRILGAADPIDVAKGFLDHGVKAMENVEPFILKWRKDAEEQERKRLESIPKDNASLAGLGEWYETKANDRDPELVMMLSHSCPHCTRMDKLIELLKDKTEVKIRIRKIYIDGNDPRIASVAESYVADVVPTLLFFSPDGKLYERVLGSLPAELLIEKFKGFGHEVFVGYDKYLEDLKRRSEDNAVKRDKLEKAIADGIVLNGGNESDSNIKDEDENKKNDGSKLTGPVNGDMEVNPNLNDKMSGEADPLLLKELEKRPLLSDIGKPEQIFGKIGARKVLGIIATNGHADRFVADIYAKHCAALEGKDGGCDTEIRVYKVSPENEKHIRKEWDVKHFPMLAFANAKGEIQDFVVGFIVPELTQEIFEELLNEPGMDESDFSPVPELK